MTPYAWSIRRGPDGLFLMAENGFAVNARLIVSIFTVAHAKHSPVQENYIKASTGFGEVIIALVPVGETRSQVEAIVDALTGGAT